MHIDPRISVAQIGIGHNHASEIMRTVRELPQRFEVRGVVEDDPHWREERGGMAPYADLPWLSEAEVLGDDSIDAVLIECTVPDLAATALRCLEAGKHIHMDKPGGLTDSDFAAVVETARQRHLTLHLGYMFRGNPAIAFCLEAVSSGLLGDIFEIDAVMSRDATSDYRRFLAGFSGGAMFIFGGHLIDLVLSMLGPPERIVALSRQTFPELDTLHDNGLAVMVYPRATATIRTSVIEIGGFLRRQLVVCGTKGTIEIHPIEPFNHPDPLPPRLRLTLAEASQGYGAGRHEVVFPHMAGRYTKLMERFADIVGGRCVNPHDYDHELLLHKCTLDACTCPAPGAHT